MPPGPELGRLLEGIDRSQLNGHELVILLQARARQVAHDQAEFYADMWELAFSTPLDPAECSEAVRTPAMDPYATDELRCALSLTRRSADIQLSIAYELVDRLPQVWEALHDGQIDLARARVICNGVVHLEPEEANRVVDSVIDQTGDLTTSQIGQRIRRRCMQVAPNAARRRYENGLSGRRVESFPNDDGTVDLVGRQLPVDRVAAIVRRVNDLARRLKGNDARTLDQIRSDVLMDLLEGRDHGTRGGQAGVEIRVDLATLLGLDEEPGEIPGWGPVIADVARRLVDDQPGARWCVVVTDPDSGVPVMTHFTRRRPTAAQQRHVRARNPVCVFPGCGAPATRSQIDHTLNHGNGGPTEIENLGPVCAHDHLGVKHTAGWGLEQPIPGTFAWTSPRGHRYVVRPPPN